MVKKLWFLSSLSLSFLCAVTTKALADTKWIAQGSVGRETFSVGGDTPSGFSYGGRLAMEADSDWEFGVFYGKATGSVSGVSGTLAVQTDYSLYMAGVDALYHFPKFEKRVFLGPMLGWGAYTNRVVEIDQSVLTQGTSRGILIGVNTGCEFPVIDGLSIGPQLKLAYLNTSGSITAIEGSIFLKYRF